MIDVDDIERQLNAVTSDRWTPAMRRVFNNAPDWTRALIARVRELEAALATATRERDEASALLDAEAALEARLASDYDTSFRAGLLRECAARTRERGTP